MCCGEHNYVLSYRDQCGVATPSDSQWIFINRNVADIYLTEYLHASLSCKVSLSTLPQSSAKQSEVPSAQMHCGRRGSLEKPPAETKRQARLLGVYRRVSCLSLSCCLFVCFWLSPYRRLTPGGLAVGYRSLFTVPDK